MLLRRLTLKSVKIYDNVNILIKYVNVRRNGVSLKLGSKYLYFNVTFLLRLEPNWREHYHYSKSVKYNININDFLKIVWFNVLHVFN